MSFNSGISEPKKFFLNLLIKLDFEIATSLYRAKNYSDAINGMAEMAAVICSQGKCDLEDVNTDLYRYQRAGTAKPQELDELFKKLQRHLMEKWFSELQLGMIPTSTLPMQTPKPKNEPMNPNQSSRL